MTVFEIQVDPERNALIRRALAKRIVRQREVEEEEASTEEDESFLGNSITIARKGSAASVSTTSGSPSKSHRHHEHHHRHHQRTQVAGVERMNAKSRWKSEYLRTTSSSPSPSGSFMSAISEIMPPEILPEILPAIIMNENSKIKNNDIVNDEKDSQGNIIDNATTATPLVTSDTVMTAPAISNGTLSTPEPPPAKNQPSIENTVSKPENTDTAPTGTVAENKPDLVEKELLMKLEELRKEKSRLFALFRNALRRKEEAPQQQRQQQQQHMIAHSQREQEHEMRQEIQLRDELKAPKLAFSESTATTVPVRELQERDGMEIKHGNSNERAPRRPSDLNLDRIAEPLSRSSFRRREHDRVIDRSKLNLEIPRKPSISSNSSNSTSSTPTTSLAPLKRGRSRSPSTDGAPFNHRISSSGPGSFGPSLPSSYSSSHPDSTSYPNKYPRADYMGSSQHNHNQSSNNSSNNNGLPEKPQGRYHSQHSSSTRTLGTDSYHGSNEGGYHRNKANGPSSLASSSSGMNGGSGSGYRGNGFRGNGYHSHSQEPPPPLPPTRIGFGERGSSGGGRGGGGDAGSRGGSFYGHGNDGPPTAPISMLGPPGRTHMPFNRSMMQMPGSRGMAHSRMAFGSSGGRNGPPERPMSSSARPGGD
ncbi:hypothetical protein BGX28_001265, partial [Mortierella sp. GBA30]